VTRGLANRKRRGGAMTRPCGCRTEESAVSPLLKRTCMNFIDLKLDVIVIYLLIDRACAYLNVFMSLILIMLRGLFLFCDKSQR